MNYNNKNGNVNMTVIGSMIRNKYPDKDIYESFIKYINNEFSSCKSNSAIDITYLSIDSEMGQAIPIKERSNGKSEIYQNLQNILTTKVSMQKKEITDKVV